MKEKFLEIYKQWVTRPGADEFLKWLESTGFFDYLESDRVLAIEWSENIEGALPEKRIAVDIQPGQGEDQRRITIDGWKGWL